MRYAQCKKAGNNNELELITTNPFAGEMLFQPCSAQSIGTSASVRLHPAPIIPNNDSAASEKKRSAYKRVIEWDRFRIKTEVSQKSIES